MCSNRVLRFTVYLTGLSTSVLGKEVVVTDKRYLGLQTLIRGDGLIAEMKFTVRSRCRFPMFGVILSANGAPLGFELLAPIHPAFKF
jgi:hypothetical protein